MRVAAFIGVPSASSWRVSAAVSRWRAGGQTDWAKAQSSHDTPLRGRATERFQQDTPMLIGTTGSQTLKRQQMEWLPYDFERPTYAE